ncbi:Heat shock 70kD protein binding protein [Giardia lamblia P15]|uniref:Heat shock 70kD protein binding protein n=1 Tax=Giardia intestinalis (strain P15) TaxID=658858 RepID=E1F7F3_GIAIA|nr:Heat shock 70kD protein binding protein [Giardia lamblia P15]
MAEDPSNCDSCSDLPELEEMDLGANETEQLLIDYRTLSLGDPLKSYDDDAFAEAMELRARALDAYPEKLNTAILLLTDAINLCPCSALMLMSRAQVLFDIGELAAAIRDLKAATERSPTHAGSFKLLGKAYTYLCRYGEALAAYQRAQNLDYSTDVAEIIKGLSPKVEAEKREEAEAKRLFEEQQGKASAKAQKKKEQSFADRVYAEIEAAKSKGSPLPEAFRVLDNLKSEAQNLSASTAQKLLSNDTTAQAMEDPEFTRKLDEVAKNPAAAAIHMKDPKFAKAFMEIINCFK